MRYPASEKLEIIRLVENSHLSARRTLQKLGIPRSTFNRWYDRFLDGGVDALEDRTPRPNRVWSRIPEHRRDQIIELALNEPQLSPRELAVTFTDTKGYFPRSIACSRHLTSCWKGKGSNAKPSHSAACFIEKRPPNMKTLMAQSLR
jgi:transposase-like protein